MTKDEVFVYISGQYIGGDLFETEANIAKAKDLAIQLARRGIKFFCPHTHSARFCCYCPEVEKDYWMDLDLTVIRELTNCMVMTKGWEKSEGAQLEMQLAAELKQDMFEGMKDFIKWYGGLE